jgi:hypothetical protein
VTQQHDIYQRGQFPEEDLSFQAKDYSRTVKVGCADRHSDQGHHSDIIVLDFIEKAL